MASISELIKDPKVLKAALTLGAAGAGAAIGVGVHRTMAQDPSTTGDVLSGGTGAVIAGTVANHILNSDTEPADKVYADTITKIKLSAPEFDTLLTPDASEWAKRDLVKQLKESGRWKLLLQLYRTAGIGLLKDAILDDLGNTAGDYLGLWNNLSDPMGAVWYAVNLPLGAIGAGLTAGAVGLRARMQAYGHKVREAVANKLSDPDWQKLYGVDAKDVQSIKLSLLSGNKFTHMFDNDKIKAMMRRLPFEQGLKTKARWVNALLHPIQTYSLGKYNRLIQLLLEALGNLKTTAAVGTPRWKALRARARKAIQQLRRMNQRRHWTRTRRVI